jgi:hypothetical protein
MGVVWFGDLRIVMTSTNILFIRFDAAGEYKIDICMARKWVVGLSVIPQRASEVQRLGVIDSAFNPVGPCVVQQMAQRLVINGKGPQHQMQKQRGWMIKQEAPQRYCEAGK